MSIEVKAQNQTALASVKAIYDAAMEANSLLDDMQAAATAAGTTLEDIYQDAADAKREADAAAESAADALTASNTAFTQLSVVENIVGVLGLLQEHGVYSASQDTMPESEKWYFIRSGTSPDYTYAPVESPETRFDYILTEDVAIDPYKTYYVYNSTTEVYDEVENPDVSAIGTYYEFTNSPKLHGWYELTSIDSTIQNYVSSHLILTNDGLELKRDDSKYRMRLTGDNLEIIAPDGTVVGSHGQTIVLGDANEIHFEASNSAIKFCTPNQDLCWFGMNSDGIWEMHIETMFVERQVRYGDFAFIKRQNGNMSIKWLGE